MLTDTVTLLVTDYPVSTSVLHAFRIRRRSVHNSVTNGLTDLSDSSATGFGSHLFANSLVREGNRGPHPQYKRECNSAVRQGTPEAACSPGDRYSQTLSVTDFIPNSALGRNYMIKQVHPAPTL